MAGIYDTHVHLNDQIYLDLDVTSADIVKSATQAGVSIMNVVGYDVKSSKIALRYANEYPNLYAVIGIHPNEAQYFTKEAIHSLEDWANGDNVVAIGETGLDYSKSKEFAKNQKETFEAQIDIALNLGLPVVLHIKDVDGSFEAYDDTIEILKAKKVKKAVVHSYEGDLAHAKELFAMGYYLSFSGVITYKENAELLNVVKASPINQIMIETDSPYSAPVPFKGKVNYPKNAVIVADAVAKAKNMDVDDLISATRTNAQKLFNVD
ncbi:TatD family hydrolase [Mesoplasma lactucae]|nr:TatD family hydrolase [Mesoplasma lactucae]ATZ20512.1 Mg-dependent DNase [Mesoplasma lactucae ATCC 49193]MCL8216683.1 putative metal-dependent hydrolase YcfH [Mesoplasma lactucae ATCC 49193]